MGKRGPKPAPTSLKIENGTFQAYRDAGSVEVNGALPQPPGWFNDDERRMWDWSVDQLSRTHGLLSAVDSASLSRYCADWVEWLECRNMIEEEGATCVSDKGGVYTNPVVYQKNAAHDRMRRFEALFGMTASDRSSLKIANNKPTGVRVRARA